MCGARKPATPACNVEQRTGLGLAGETCPLCPCPCPGRVSVHGLQTPRSHRPGLRLADSPARQGPGGRRDACSQRSVFPGPGCALQPFTARWDGMLQAPAGPGPAPGNSTSGDGRQGRGKGRCAASALPGGRPVELIRAQPHVKSSAPRVHGRACSVVSGQAGVGVWARAQTPHPPPPRPPTPSPENPGWWGAHLQKLSPGPAGRLSPHGAEFPTRPRCRPPAPQKGPECAAQYKEFIQSRQGTRASLSPVRTGDRTVCPLRPHSAPRSTLQLFS